MHHDFYKKDVHVLIFEGNIRQMSFLTFISMLQSALKAAMARRAVGSASVNMGRSVITSVVGARVPRDGEEDIVRKLVLRGSLV